jgi:RNA polymerase sigma factor (sigma-70 family)
MPPAQSHDTDATNAAAVRAAVAALADRQRLVVVARFFMDLSVEDTAQLLECAPGTVRATAHQAVQRLRAMGLDVDDELQEVQ